jgi:hypothetical protein
MVAHRLLTPTGAHRDGDLPQPRRGGGVEGVRGDARHGGRDVRPGLRAALEVPAADALEERGDPYARSQEMMLSSITSLLEAAAGHVRPDIGARDILTSLTGIALAAGAPEQRDQAERLLDLIMDGLRHPARR